MRRGRRWARCGTGSTCRLSFEVSCAVWEGPCGHLPTLQVASPRVNDESFAFRSGCTSRAAIIHGHGDYAFHAATIQFCGLLWLCK